MLIATCSDNANYTLHLFYNQMTNLDQAAKYKAGKKKHTFSETQHLKMKIRIITVKKKKCFR